MAHCHSGLPAAYYGVVRRHELGRLLKRSRWLSTGGSAARMVLAYTAPRTLGHETRTHEAPSLRRPHVFECLIASSRPAGRSAMPSLRCDWAGAPRIITLEWRPQEAGACGPRDDRALMAGASQPGARREVAAPVAGGVCSACLTEDGPAVQRGAGRGRCPLVGYRIDRSLDSFHLISAPSRLR